MQRIQEPKIQINIHDRIYSFVLSVVNTTTKLQNNPQNIIFINQILMSSTSVSAYSQEADAAKSRKDFIAKYTITKKGLKETAFWLKNILDTNQTINNGITLLRNESEELLKIISKIIINTKNKS